MSSDDLYFVFTIIKKRFKWETLSTILCECVYARAREKNTPNFFRSFLYPSLLLAPSCGRMSIGQKRLLNQLLPSQVLTFETKGGILQVL